MNRNLLIFSLTVILFLAQSCATTSTFQVSKVGNEPEKTTEKVVYVLPQTALFVTVNFEKETFIPGPYRIFSEKYLGMKSLIDEPGFSYRITGVDVKTTTQPDENQYYSINVLSGHPDLQNFLRLGQEGLVLDPSHLYEFTNYNEKAPAIEEAPYFTDLSVKKNLRETTDTLYKTMIRDSSYVRIPVVRKQKEAKTVEQKAEEAANFIIKIRKRRFKLLDGEYKVFPKGDALALSVKELDKLEKEYLALFLGKTIRQQYTRSFVVVPEASANKQAVTIARFSGQIGLTDQENTTGNEVIVEIQPLNKVRELRKDAANYPDPQMQNNLFYRIPDLADIRVRVSSDILYESRVSIYQAGAMVNLPVGE